MFVVKWELDWKSKNDIRYIIIMTYGVSDDFITDKLKRKFNNLSRPDLVNGIKYSDGCRISGIVVHGKF